MTTMDRRTFLETTAAASAMAALNLRPATAAQAGGGLKKAVYVSMLPKELGYLDKFTLRRARSRPCPRAAPRG